MKLPFQIDLTGKVVVVTGAGGVICSVLAEAMAMTGAKVALLDLNEDAAKKHADDITAKGYIAKGYKCNVLEKASVQAARDQIAADFGTCDILINGAGGNNPKATTDDEYFVPEDLGQMKTFFDLDADGVSFVFSLNFMGTLIPTQVFALDMVNKKGASIINISSMNAYTPLTKIPAFKKSKKLQFPTLPNGLQCIFPRWVSAATRSHRDFSPHSRMQSFCSMRMGHRQPEPARF